MALKFHGIEIGSLSVAEIEAADAAIRLLHDLHYGLYGVNNRAWKVLIRAQKYLEDITKPHKNGVPRTFNRDLAFPVTKDADGNRLCRWDQKAVPRKRMSYCSEQCRIEVDIRTSAGSLRYHVKQRDKGVCADCGLDTQRLKRILDHAARSYYEIRNGIGSTERTWWRGDFSREEASLLARLGFDRNISFWQADHIIEVVNGGESTLENAQTLCVPCHKAKTKQMHAARKVARTGVAPCEPVRETQLRIL
jgi:hypothetical protein